MVCKHVFSMQKKHKYFSIHENQEIQKKMLQFASIIINCYTGIVLKFHVAMMCP